MAASGIEQQKDQNKDPKPAIKTAGKVVGPIMSHPIVHGPRKIVKAVCALFITLAAVGGIIWAPLHHRSPSSSKATDTVGQASLQKSIASDINSGNSQAVVNDATDLINGKRLGKYTFSNVELAQYYMQAGSSFYNLKEYTKAATYFEAAPQYDATLKEASLEGEVSAEYAAGERQQLIPMLEQLETMSAQAHDPMTPTPAQYQYDISAIQHGQEANL